MGIYSAVDCCEEAGTARENYQEFPTGILEASVTLRCAWADRHTLAQDIVGNRRAWPKGGFVVPLARTAAIVPVITPGSPTQVNQEINYGQALVTITYSSIVSDLVTHSIEPATDFITLDYRRFRWGAANGLELAEDEAPGLLVHKLNLVITEYEVSPPLSASLLSKPGGVNQSTFSSTILGLSFAAETLLMNDPVISTSRNTLGQLKTQVVKKFTYQRQGWNKYFRAATNSWESIYVAGGSEYKCYPVTDFTDVLN